MPRKYSPGASKDVEKEMHKFNEGTLKSAIAIGLSEARKAGEKVPLKRSANK